MSGEVDFICTVLTESVAVLADADSSLQDRSEAQRFCDELKDKPTLCIPCGLILTDRNKPVPVRLFGFQILEHYVTRHWVVSSPKERKHFKTKVVDLVSTGVTTGLDEEECLWEAVARLVVEMMKQEEPEYLLLTVLGNLKEIVAMGPVQAELVMLVLLRLSEDVVSIGGQCPVPHYKVILQNNVHVVLEMVRAFIQDRVKTYQLLKVRTRARVIKAALKTLVGYITWVPVFRISSCNYKLLDTLWCLLNNPELQLEASECLLVAINRIATHSNHTPMLVLFDTVASLYIFHVPRTTAHVVLTDKLHSFLKKLCQILCVFGQQLCHIMSIVKWQMAAPSNFGKYLDSLVGFTTHSSLYLSSLTQSTWKALFSLECLTKNPHLQAAIPKYLCASRMKLLKVGFPSKNNSPSCACSRFDYATDVEFYKFLTTFRDDQKQVIDAVCRLDPITCFRMASTWLKVLLKPPIDSSSKSSTVGGSLQSSSINSFLQWEAMTFFFKVIFTNMLQNLKREAIPVNDGIELLKLLLNFKTKEPRVLACIPINIYTLLPLLNFKNECLPQVLTKLLEIIEEVNAKSHTRNSVRRDACSCIIRMCRGHAKVLLPSFALLFNHVKQLLCNERLQLTQMERSTLMEAMVVLINNFKDFEQQKAYLEELMAPVSSLWLSEEMRIVLADPESFVSYVGGNLMSTDTTVESPTDLNRSGIIHCVATILGVLRWTQSPTDPEKTGVMANNKPIRPNPCAEQVLKLLDNLFVLLRTQHNLYFPGVLSKLGEHFSKSLDRPEVKNNSPLDLPPPLLDIYDPPEYKTALERMQGFFSALYASCFYILGCAGSSLNKDFYTFSNLADKIGNSAFVNLEYIPHYRLLCIVRVFLRPLLLSCPPQYHESLVSPIMGLFLPSLRLRLYYGWNDIDLRVMVSKEKNAFEKSKLEEKILTKEVLQLIIDCCVDKDKIVVTDGPSVMNTCESLKDYCNQGADVGASMCGHDRGTSFSSADSQVTEASVFASFCEDAEIGVYAACSEGAETFVSAAPSQDIDDNVATAETDVCCVSNEDAGMFVCTAESDDDDLCVADAPSCVLSEKVEIDKESDFACYAPSENPVSSFEFNDACSVANRGPDSETVAGKIDTVCIVLENIDASVVSSDYNEGEMAAEVPQKQNSTAQEQAPLTKLGICLMKDEDIRSVLLNTSFSSLVWKDFCHKAATCLCWPLMQHVMFEPLLVETVIHLFTMVMKGLQMHRDDPLESDTLARLAYRIYVSLRPRYIELNRVMRQIPNINLFSLDTFDEMLLNVTIQKPDNALQQYFKDLIKCGVHETFPEPASNLQRKRKPVDPDDSEL